MVLNCQRSSSPRRVPLGATLGLLGSLALTACGNGSPGGAPSGGATLQGAGATFPASIYQRWFAELAAKGEARVNYQSVGSGAGVRQFSAGTVDFAASDKPLDAEEAAVVKRGVVQIPLTAGAIAVAYNHPGCSLKLTQAQLVGIFEGKITNYRELGCADQAIKVVFRSDGSGTTYNFTNSSQPSAPAGSRAPAPPNPCSGPRASAPRATREWPPACSR